MALTPTRRITVLALAVTLALGGATASCRSQGTSRPFDKAFEAGVIRHQVEEAAAQREVEEAARLVEEARLAAEKAAAENAARKAREVRTSRQRVHRPRVVVAAALAPPTPQPVGCDAWGYKSRAESDACWGPIIASYGDWSTARMLAILYCESTGNPWVVNASNHVGLFQIKNSHTKGNGSANIAHAHGMWKKSGTAPWRQCGG